MIISLGFGFGAVAGQVESLDLLFVLGKPRLHRLTEMYPQVVQNQIDLAALVACSGVSFSTVR